MCTGVLSGASIREMRDGWGCLGDRFTASGKGEALTGILSMLLMNMTAKYKNKMCLSTSRPRPI